MALRLSAGPYGAITRVQSKSGNTGASGSATLTVTLDTAPAIGNFVVMAVSARSTGIKFAIENSASSPQCEMTGYHLFSAAMVVALYWAEVRGSGASAFTVTTTNANQIAAVVAEYNAATRLRPDVVPATSTGTSTSPATGGGSTVRTATQLWIGAIGQANNNNGTLFSSPINSYAIVEQTNTSTTGAAVDRSVALLERFITTPAAIASCGVTSSVNQLWAAIAMPLRLSPAFPN